MKKTLIKLVCALTALLMLFVVLASCDEKASYRNDLEAKAVCDKAEECIPVTDGYYSADNDYLGFYFSGADTIVENYDIRFARASTNINQFGVFKVKDGKADEMVALCESYIATMLDRWVAQADYIESEHPKMANAAVKVCGNYVIYTMLLPADRTTVFNAVDGLLRK